MQKIKYRRVYDDQMTNELMDRLLEYKLHLDDGDAPVGGLKQLYRQHLAATTVLEKPFAGMWIATLDDVPVGVVAVTTYNSDGGCRAMVYVSQPCRKQGIARELLRRLWDSGFVGVQMWVTDSNRALLRRYKSFIPVFGISDLDFQANAALNALRDSGDWVRLDKTGKIEAVLASRTIADTILAQKERIRELLPLELYSKGRLP